MTTGLDDNQLSLLGKLQRRKPVEKSLSEATQEKTLRWYDMTAYGIAATVGSGIYVTAGKVARLQAGPAVLASIWITGGLSLLTGLCYLEFASALPISGSGYAYFYTAMGELLAWFIGWNMTLEYGFAGATVAGGWINYLVGLLGDVGVRVPTWMYRIEPFGITSGAFLSLFKINLLAGVLVLLVGLLVSRGAKFGARFTNVITAINIGIILFIIVTGVFYVKPSNWTPFAPYGLSGIFSGSATMFFSYIGYDTVSTLACDAINPGRDVPIAVLLTVGTATVFYSGVALVLTGMIPYASLDEQSPLAQAFITVGASWASYIVSACALTTMGATLLACTIGQPKIFQAIAQDGLLPARFAKESRGIAPYSLGLAVITAALLAVFFDTTDELLDMISFGTLFGMTCVCAALMVVRIRQSINRTVQMVGYAAIAWFWLGAAVASTIYNHTSLLVSGLASIPLVLLPFLLLCGIFVRWRFELGSKSLAFACPLVPVMPCGAILANSFIMYKTPVAPILGFLLWTVIGLLIYFGYGLSHSHLGRPSMETRSK